MRAIHIGLKSALIIVGVTGCQSDKDTVDPSSYTAGQAAAAGTTAGIAAGGGGTTGSITSPVGAAGTAASTGVGPATGTGGIGGVGPIAGSGVAGSGGPIAGSSGPTAGTSGPIAGTSGPIAGGGVAGGSGPIAGGGAAGSGGNPAPAGPCDLTGRWLYTTHFVTTALGVEQYSHTYLYYEIEQQGSAFTVKKGLQCGDDTLGSGALSGTVNVEPSWPEARKRITAHNGRTGTSAEAAGGGCAIEIAKLYVVRGASDYYLDPKNKLPTAKDMAMDTTPGWEDWDSDGNPGITGDISGAVTGKIFTSPRAWTSFKGTAPDLKKVVKLPLSWDQEQNVMSTQPADSAILMTQAGIANDPAKHFVQLARLEPTQATGDDQAICDSIITLAKTLTPEAAGL